MSTSKGVSNAQAIVAMVLTILPWILRIFGVDVPDIEGANELSSELAMSLTGTAVLAQSHPVIKA